ncbi:MAG TPA: DUF488 domain-containing protein [Cyclobacteriaceae bacterium]
MAPKRLHTVGHSTHEINYFIGLLTAYNINCVVDVRTLAASKFNPQYNKSALSASLRDSKITYMHMADEFGARHTDPALLTNGRVDFDKVRRSESFKRGVERIRHGTNKGFRIALMCAEADPLVCHRFSLISVALKDEFEIVHILKDKSSITQLDLEGEMLKKFKKKLLTSDLFQSAHTYDERLKAAYRLQNDEIGYSSGSQK